MKIHSIFHFLIKTKDLFKNAVNDNIFYPAFKFDSSTVIKQFLIIQDVICIVKNKKPYSIKNIFNKYACPFHEFIYKDWMNECVKSFLQSKENISTLLARVMHWDGLLVFPPHLTCRSCHCYISSNCDLSWLSIVSGWIYTLVDRVQVDPIFQEKMQNIYATFITNIHQKQTDLYNKLNALQFIAPLYICKLLLLCWDTQGRN